MTFGSHFRRQVSECQKLRISQIPGVHYALLEHFSPKQLRPFAGHLARHLLVLMRHGTAIAACAGHSYEARAGDAILLPAGDVRLCFEFSRGVTAVSAEIIEFDHRTIAAVLNGHAAFESLVLSHPDRSTGAVEMPRFLRRIFHDWQTYPEPVMRIQHAINIMIVHGWPGIFGFLREHYYQRRWMLCTTLERAVRAANAEARAAAIYPGGLVKLRKDCRTFLGAEPRQIINRRRCQLASAWLRGDHSIEEVGVAAGFATTAEFQSSYAGITGRSCAATQALPPLTALDPEELLELLVPCWWPSDRPRKFAIPKLADQAPDILTEEQRADFMTELISDNSVSRGQFEWISKGPECMELCWVEANVGAAESANGDAPPPPPVRTRMEEYVAQRKLATDELMEQVQPFFAMESTGAEIVVPFFEAAAEDDSEESLAA